MDSTLSVQQAAAHFGVSEKTIRRRITSGELSAVKVPTAQGYEWRIHLDTAAVQVPGNAVYLDAHTDQAPGQTPIQAEPETNEAMIQALALATQLQQENTRLSTNVTQLAGQVGFLQAKLQDAEERIRLLTDAQHDTAHEAAPERPAEPAPPTGWRGLVRRILRPH